MARGPQYRRLPAQDSNPSGQAAVAVSPVRRRRPAKAAERLPVTAKVGEIFLLHPFLGQDRKIKTVKMTEMMGQVGKMGLLIRVQTVATERSLLQVLETPRLRTTPRGRAGRPVRQHDCQPGKPAAAVKQETPRLAPRMEAQVGIQSLQMAL